MLLFASFPTPKPQQAEIVQVTAPPLSKFFTTPSASKRLSASSASSIFASLGLKQPPRRTDSLETPRPSKCTHQSVTRFYTAASTPTPQDLEVGAHWCCQRCCKQHYFRWIYVCDNCSARACHNCRPRWADRAWGSFGSLLGRGSPMHGGEKEKVVGSVDGRAEKVSSVLEPKRRSKRWSGGSWLKDKGLT